VAYGERILIYLDLSTPLTGSKRNAASKGGRDCGRRCGTKGCGTNIEMGDFLFCKCRRR